MVQDCGGIEYTIDKIKQISEKAKLELSIFENSVYKINLINL